MKFWVNKQELVGKYSIVDINDTGFDRKLSLINPGNQLHNHASKKPLQHVKAIMFTSKETKDKEKDVRKIQQLATCAEKSGPYLKMQGLR